ncbi:MAG: TauD/TfdA family dioxygenase [Aromatoleum sp.]|nr:TauD/TfdA family dioxygenase [Aromatoleum sp.]
MQICAQDTMKVVKLGEHIGAEVAGVDLSKPVDAQTKRRLNEALVHNVALVIKNQNFDARQFLAAGSLFGEPMARAYSNPLPDVPLVQRISSHTRNKDGSVYRTGPRWHTDQADHEYPPKYTALYAIELFRTGGGTTGILNMRAVYDSLPESLKKRVDGMKTVYASADSASKNLDTDGIAGQGAAKRELVIHPLVRTNPDTGRKAIYFHPGRVKNIVGMTPEDSYKLLDELLASALKPQYIYNHDWTLGDMLIWDNRSALHKANYDYDPTDMSQHRCMYRMLVNGERPY